MGTEIRWDNDEQTALFLRFVKPWTWEDFDAIVDEAADMIRSVPHTVHLIQDLTESGGTPDPHAISHMQRMASLAPDNMGTIVFAGMSGFGNRMVSIIGKVYPSLRKRFKVVNSVEEARRWLAEADTEDT